MVNPRINRLLVRIIDKLASSPTPKIEFFVMQFNLQDGSYTGWPKNKKIRFLQYTAIRVSMQSGWNLADLFLSWREGATIIFFNLHFSFLSSSQFYWLQGWKGDENSLGNTFPSLKEQSWRCLEQQIKNLRKKNQIILPISEI